MMKITLLWKKQLFSIYQKKLLRWAAFFGVIFLLCALVSRGLYSMGMPKVTTVAISQTTLTHTIKADGTVVGSREVAVAVEPGLLIASVLVESGQQIEKGAPLVQLDLNDLAKKIDDKMTEITKQEVTIQALADNQVLNQQEKNTARNRASQDYTNAQNDTATNVTKAQQSLDVSQNARNELGSRESYIQSKKNKDNELKNLNQKISVLTEKLAELSKDQAAQQNEKNKIKNELNEAIDAREAHETSLIAALGSDWDTQKQQLDSDVAAGEQALNDARKAGADSERLAARALEDAGTALPKDSSLAVAQTELAQLNKQLVKYQELQQAGGIIKAAKKGDIIKINLGAGEITSESALLTMNNPKKGYRFEAIILQEQKKYVELKDQGTVSLQNNIPLDITIDAIEEQPETGTYLISGPIKGEAVLGDQGSLMLEKGDGKEQICVPLSTLHGSNTNIYVFVAESRQTILGEELKAVKYMVKILDKNDTYAAVETSLTEDMLIIDQTTKLVTEGDPVRLQEEQ